jgi:hypothetical protein
LRIAHRVAGAQLEQAPARAIREAPRPGHGSEIVEAVADDEVGGGRGCDERWNRPCGMLAVRVDGEHGVGARR